MIIYNSKAYATNFTKVDNVTIEIFANYSIEEFFAKMEKGEDVSDAVIKMYKVTEMDPALAEYKVRPTDDEVRHELFGSNANKSAMCDYATAIQIAHYGDMAIGNEFLRGLSLKIIRERKDDFRSLAYDIENSERVLSFSGASMAAGTAYGEVEVDMDVVKGQVKDSLGIMPDDNRVEMPLVERQKDAVEQRRIMWEMTGTTHDFEFWTSLPTNEEFEFYNGLNVNEKRLVCNSLLNPRFAIWMARFYKEMNPGLPVTTDFISAMESYWYHKDRSVVTEESVRHLIERTVASNARNQDPDIARADTAFKAAFRGRSPRILNDIILAYRRLYGKTDTLSDADIDSMVKMFNPNSVKNVAKTENLNLIALALVCDLSTVKKSHIEILTSYLSGKEFRDGEFIGVENGREARIHIYPNLREFCLWYAKTGKKCTDKNLLSTLECFRQLECREFKDNLSYADIYDLINNRKAIEDKRNYERQYHYSFEDNILAIRGRDIEVDQGRFRMYMLPATDLRNYTVGYDTQCCQHWGGAGGSCVWKLTTDPFAGVVVVEDINTRDILAQAFVWTDEAKDTFVFDNIEFANQTGRTANLYTSIIAKYVGELPYANVHMGTGYTEGVYTSWGKKVSTRTFAKMPDVYGHGGHVYSDYHSNNARVFKDKGSIQIPGGKGSVHHNEFIPTDYDQFLGPDNPLKYFLSANIPMEEKIRKAEELRNNPSDELIDEFVRGNVNVVRDHMFDHIPEGTQHWLLSDPDNFELLVDIPNPTAEVVQAILERNPSLIGQMLREGKATSANVLPCLERDGSLICVLPEITHEYAMAAVSSDGSAIEHIIQMAPDLVDEELMRAAAASDPASIVLMPMASEEVKADGIRSDPDSIGLMEDPSPELQVLAASLYPASLLGVENPCEEAVRTALNGNWHLVRNYVKDFPELCLEVSRQHEDEIDIILSPAIMDRLTH